MKLAVTLATALVLIVSVAAHAQTTDASKWARPNVGFSKPPASVADEAQSVPAAGIQGQVTAGQVQSIDGSQVTGIVQNAANAQQAEQANTAAAAQTLDPNAPIDASKITGLPSCASDEGITVEAGVFKCRKLASAGGSGSGFTQSTTLTANGQSFAVPAGITRMRVTRSTGPITTYFESCSTNWDGFVDCDPAGSSQSAGSASVTTYTVTAGMAFTLSVGGSWSYSNGSPHPSGSASRCYTGNGTCSATYNVSVNHSVPAGASVFEATAPAQTTASPLLKLEW